MKRVARKIFTSDVRWWRFFVGRAGLEITPELLTSRGDFMLSSVKEIVDDPYHSWNNTYLSVALDSYEEAGNRDEVLSVAQRAEGVMEYRIAFDAYTLLAVSYHSPEEYTTFYSGKVRNAELCFVNLNCWGSEEWEVLTKLANEVGVNPMHTELLNRRGDAQLEKRRFESALIAYIKAGNEEGVQNVIREEASQQKNKK